MDLWPTDSEVSFATATARAIAESMSTAVDMLLDTAKTFFGRLVPSITVDDEGKPQVTFGISRASDPGPVIDEVLAAPVKIATQRQKKVVMVFDEFQQILSYDSDMVERRLRSSIQNHKDVAYIFLGSRKHLIQKMFLDKSRPLYRAGGHYGVSVGSEMVSSKFKFITYAAGKGIKVQKGDKNFYMVKNRHPHAAIEFLGVVFEHEGDTWAWR